MKNYGLLIILLMFANGIQAQTRETRDVRKFTKITFAHPGKLYLKQGSPQRVELEGEAGILKEVETVVDGNHLKIRKKNEGWFNWGLSDSEKIIVYITVADIEGINVSGSGDIIGQSKIKAGDIDIRVSGSGSLTVEIDAREVDADVAGSGDIRLSGHFRSLDTDVSGSGKVILSASIDESAEFDVSGSGRIEANGNTNRVKVSVSGSGKVMAADLKANRCEVRISGSGSVAVNVVDELNANISGSGSVSYRGSPRKVNSHSSGSGKVKKI